VKKKLPKAVSHQKKVLVVGSSALTRQLRDVFFQLSVATEGAGSTKQFLQKIKKFNPDLVILHSDYKRYFSEELISFLKRHKQRFFVILSSEPDPQLILKAQQWNAAGFWLGPYNTRELINHLNAVLYQKTQITCLGGGTGLYHLLSGLKSIPSVLLTSIVSMSDDGGSSGRLRIEHGILPPGDVRRSLVALSDAPELMNEVIQHRFTKGAELKDHNFGNLFLTVLEEIKGSMPEAIRALGDLLNIRGIVLPATTTSSQLVAEFKDGSVVRGESKIDLCLDRDPDLHIRKLYHEPQVQCNAEAYASIIFSDFVTIGPGDLFTSVITNLAIQGMREALQKTKAKKIYFCNLMTKPGETSRFTAYDHIREVLQYMGGDYLDYVFISNTAFSKKARQVYALKNQLPVLAPDVTKIKSLTKAKIILADLAHATELVRHDSLKVKKQIQQLIREEKNV
jgi:uncharacterized cofD-like protein